MGLLWKDFDVLLSNRLEIIVRFFVHYMALPNRKKCNDCEKEIYKDINL